MPAKSGHSIRVLNFLAAAALGLPCGSAAEELRYNIQPKQVIPYKFTIVADTPTSQDTMSGIVAFTGKKSGKEQMTVGYVGHLNRQTKSKSSGSRRGPSGFSRFGGPGFRGPGGPPGFGRGVTHGGLSRTSNELVVSRTGKIRRLVGQSQLPYLLGNLSIMPFEALPASEKKEWSVGTGLSITEEDDSPFFGGPFRGNTTTESGGHESATYKIQSDDGTLLKIAKTYELNAPAPTENDHAIEIKGTGVFTFNRELGVSDSLEMKHTFVVTQSGSKVSFPMTVAWTRVPVEQWDKQEKDHADRIAKLVKDRHARDAKARAAAAEAAGKKLSADAKKKIMADLNSSHWPATANRLRSLGSFVPHPDDFDVALRIKELQSSKIASVFMPARKMWPKLEKVIDEAKQQMAAQSNDNPFATEDEKKPPEGLGMREWTDSTGAFKIEAEFVEFDGNNIVLKRKDGKEVRLPVSRLSDADQKIAAGLKGIPPNKK